MCNIYIYAILADIKMTHIYIGRDSFPSLALAVYTLLIFKVMMDRSMVDNFWERLRTEPCKLFL